MILYIDAPLKEKGKALLQQSIPGTLQFYFKEDLPDDEERLQKLGAADIVFGNPKKEWITQATNARWIQLHSAGFEYYQNLELSAVVTNMQDYFSQPCAETMIAGIMAIYRKIDRFTLLKENRKWVGASIRPELQLLQGKKVILLGTGTIARRIARILQAFDAQVVFFGRTAPDAELKTKDALLQKIGWAEIIIGCLPGTEETKGLISNEMIAQMTPATIFCNVGRGNLVSDQQVLAAALNKGQIAGAVLDVTSVEPIPSDDVLWSCPNLILTQHSAGGQNTEAEGLVQFFLQNLERFLSNQPLQNIVQVRKGY